jgi:hypothetical protein
MIRINLVAHFITLLKGSIRLSYSYMRSEKLLKNYIENRFSMEERDLQKLVVELSRCRIKPNDNRLLNLKATIHRKLPELQL